MRKRVLVLWLLLLVLSVSGCGQTSKNLDSQPTSEEVKKTKTHPEGDEKGSKDNPYIIGKDTITFSSIDGYDRDSLSTITLSNLELFYGDAASGKAKDIESLMFDLQVDSVQDNSKPCNIEHHMDIRQIDSNMKEVGGYSIHSLNVESSGRITTDGFFPEVYEGGKIKAGITPYSQGEYSTADETPVIKYYVLYYEVIDDSKGYDSTIMYGPVWIQKE